MYHTSGPAFTPQPASASNMGAGSGLSTAASPAPTMARNKGAQPSRSASARSSGPCLLLFTAIGTSSAAPALSAASAPGIAVSTVKCRARTSA
jgi:hypothetical protein